jgi:hypothetical protein
MEKNLSKILTKHSNNPMSTTIKGELEPLSDPLVLSMPTGLRICLHQMTKNPKD